MKDSPKLKEKIWYRALVVIYLFFVIIVLVLAGGIAGAVIDKEVTKGVPVPETGACLYPGEIPNKIVSNNENYRYCSYDDSSMVCNKILNKYCKEEIKIFERIEAEKPTDADEFYYMNHPDGIDYSGAWRVSSSVTIVTVPVSGWYILGIVLLTVCLTGAFLYLVGKLIKKSIEYILFGNKSTHK